MTAQSVAQVEAMVERHGWADALDRIVAEAPPAPADAIALLRATGYPVGAKLSAAGALPIRPRRAPVVEPSLSGRSAARPGTGSGPSPVDAPSPGEVPE